MFLSGACEEAVGGVLMWEVEQIPREFVGGPGRGSCDAVGGDQRVRNKPRPSLDT